MVFLKMCGMFLAILFFVCCLTLHSTNGAAVGIRKHESNDQNAVTGQRNMTEHKFLRRQRRAISAVIGSAIAAGTSLIGTTTQALVTNNGFTVTIGIEVENYSKWLLSQPEVYNGHGYVSNSPRPIRPGTRETMVAHKGSGGTGTYGTVSWRLNLDGNDDTRVVLMWSAPYNFDFYSNAFGVGICLSDISVDDNYDDNGDEHTFNAMYYGNTQLSDVRYYYYTVKPVSYCCLSFCVTATMGTSHKPEAHVSIFPRHHENLADSIKPAVSKVAYETFVQRHVQAPQGNLQSRRN